MSAPALAFNFTPTSHLPSSDLVALTDGSVIKTRFVFTAGFGTCNEDPGKPHPSPGEAASAKLVRSRGPAIGGESEVEERESARTEHPTGSSLRLVRACVQSCDALLFMTSTQLQKFNDCLTTPSCSYLRAGALPLSLQD